MIYTVTLNPALDKTVEIPNLTIDGVNRISSMRTDPGGKGINVSKVIQKLGGTSIATGILGGETGHSIESALKEAGLNSFFHYVEGETRTNLKIIDTVSHTNTDINEPGVTVSEEILSKLLSDLSDRIQEGDIVVLSGSIPKGAPENTYYVWTKACRKLGAKVILDADGELFREGIQAAPYLIKPNHHELSAFCRERINYSDRDCAGSKKFDEGMGDSKDSCFYGRKRSSLPYENRNYLCRRIKSTGWKYGRCRRQCCCSTGTFRRKRNEFRRNRSSFYSNGCGKCNVQWNTSCRV